MTTFAERSRRTMRGKQRAAEHNEQFTHAQLRRAYRELQIEYASALRQIKLLNGYCQRLAEKLLKKC